MGLSHKQKLMIATLVFGTFVTVLNQTIVAPAFPSIMKEMSIDETTVQWLSTGFTLMNAIMIPITAYLQERFSIKGLFLFSMGIFSLGSLLCAWGPVFVVVLAGRLVQAAGAGVLMPLAMTVLLVTFPVEKRGFALGIFGMVGAFAPAIGPTMAGVIIDAADWHIMFYITSALAAAVFLGAAFTMEGGQRSVKKGAAFDLLSVVLSTSGFGTLLYSFSAFGTQGLSAVVIGCALFGILAIACFAYRQTKLPVPMLRIQVLGNRRFLIATIVSMLVQGSLLTTGMLLPIYNQSLMGYSATVSGLVMLPGAIVMGVMNLVAGKIFDTRGARGLSIVGLSTLFVATVGFGMLSFETPLWLVVAIFAVRMFALALSNMPITTWGMNALPTEYMNHGTSVNNTLRMVAGSMSTAVVISVSAMVQNLEAPEFGIEQAHMFGVDAAFLAFAAMVLVGLVLAIVYVKPEKKKSD